MRIGAQARHHAIKPQRKRDDRQAVVPEDTRPPKWPDTRHKHERGQRYKTDRQECTEVASGCIKNGDSLALVERVLQNGSRFTRREVVKRRKHRAKPDKLRRNAHGVNRFRVEVDRISSCDANALKGLMIRILVGKQNRWRALAILTEITGKLRPRTAAARAQIDDAIGSSLGERTPQTG